MRSSGTIATRVGAVAVAVLTLSGSLLLWWVVTFTADIGRAVSEMGASDARSLVSETREVIDGTVVSLAALSNLGTNLEGATRDTAVALADAGRLIEDDVAGSLESVEEAMPALIEAGDVIDTTLRALSFFGVDYAPAVPFDEALMGVEESLSGLPEDVRDQGAQIRVLAPQVDSLSADTALIIDSLDQLERQLADVGSTLEALEDSNEDLSRVTGLLLTIEDWLPIVRTLIGVSTLAGVSLAVAMWRLGSPEPDQADTSDHHRVVHT